MKMNDNEFQGIVRSMIQSAEHYVEETLSPRRATKTEYYNGQMYDLEADEGRSQMVSRDVRDTVKAILPSVMRVFTSSEKVVEYIPTSPEDVANAEQATDYAN